MLRVFRSSKLSYLLVGIAAFMLGSATVGAAAATAPAVLGTIFYTTIFNGQATQPCTSTTTSSGTTTVCNAIVDSNGNLHVANQGTSTVSGSVGVTNFPADQQVHGTVGVNNFPADQLIHGSVTVSNLPGVSGGTTAIPLGVQTAVPSGGLTTIGVQVSSCREFSFFLTTPLFTTGPRIDNVYLQAADATLVPLDHHDKTLDNGTFTFVTWPGTNEPAFGTHIVIYAINADGQTQDISAELLCSQ